MPGPKSGVGARHALFPIRTTLGASLSRAVCFPTLLIAACDAVGLIAGPSRPFQLRNFSSEASAPGSVPSADGELAGRVLARLQQCISRQHLATGTAPAFGRALAPCNGSDLLPLRLPFAHKPAVLFVASLTYWKINEACLLSDPSRPECSLCPAFQRLSFG